MNYHGYLIIRGAARGGSWADNFFDPWTGPLATRFAATFVLVAGVGVTLLTRQGVDDMDRVIDMRWRLIRRGAVLYAVGLCLDLIWKGTIIPYYGAMFVLGAFIFNLRSRWIFVVSAVAVGAGVLIGTWRFWRQEAAGLRLRYLRERHTSAVSVARFFLRWHPAGTHAGPT